MVSKNEWAKVEILDQDLFSVILKYKEKP